MLMQAVVAWGQANQPLQVEPASAAPGNTQPVPSEHRRNVSEPAGQPPTGQGDALTDLARRLAGRDGATSPAAEPSPGATSVSPATASILAHDDDASAQSSAQPSAEALVKPVHPNEQRALGPSPQGRSGVPSSQTDDGQALDHGWDITQTLLALGFIIALLLIGRQVLLKWTGRPAAVSRSRLVEVLARVNVGPRQQVMLLRLGGRILVVGDSAGQMRPLADIDDPEEVASILKDVSASRPASISQGFGQLLGRFDQDHDRVERSARREEGTDDAEHQVDRARDQLSGLLSKMRTMSGKGGRP